MKKEVFEILIENASGDEKKELYRAYITSQVRNKLFESFLDPIKLKGDEVWINDKLVGHLDNDLNDFDKGIIFKDLKGETEEFTEIKDLYTYLIDKFNNGEE
jgi:hypothetical protein